ncbi:MAG: hypothetical protein QOE45_795 [Frankiaceae bacterium]|nr:hypothetical protein [Frankiaceae bacterium]
MLAVAGSLAAYTTGAGAEVCTGDVGLSASVVHVEPGPLADSRGVVTTDDCVDVLLPPHLMLPNDGLATASVSGTLGSAAAKGNAGASTQQELLYWGGAIQKAQRIYLTYWGWPSNLTQAQRDYRTTLQSFLADLAGSAYLGIDFQYDESKRGAIGTASYGGAWSDARAIPAAPSNAQLAGEAARAASHFGGGVDAVYVVATPPHHNEPHAGVDYCAWHSYIPRTSGPGIAFVNLPYLGDMVAMCSPDYHDPLNALTTVTGHEIAEAQTDPDVHTGWHDDDGKENADKCEWGGIDGRAPQPARHTVGAHLYTVQPLWSNQSMRCVFSEAAGDADIAATRARADGSHRVTSFCQFVVTGADTDLLASPGGGRMTGQTADRDYNVPSPGDPVSTEVETSGAVLPGVPVDASIDCRLETSGPTQRVTGYRPGPEADADSGYTFDYGPMGTNTTCLVGDVRYTDGTTTNPDTCVTF